MEHYGGYGEGVFRKSTLGNQLMASALGPTLKTIIDDMVMPSDGPFVLCDYGCADGGTTLDLISAAIEMLREKQADLPIHVVYEDLPAADFISLFRLLNGELGKQSYREKYPDVYVSAVGVNYFQQCLPKQTLHLGLAINSMMYLSKIPCALTESVTAYNPACVREERALYQQQLVADFTTTLLHRAKEMQKGGYMVVLFPHSYTEESWFQFLIENRWKEYAKDGRITQEELYNTNGPCTFLTRAEIRGMFEQETTLPAAGLQLVSLEESHLPCPFEEQLMASGGYGCQDAVRHYARELTQCYRAYDYGTYYNALSPQRSPEQRAQLVENVFADVADIVTENPRKHGQRWDSFVLVIKKRM